MKPVISSRPKLSLRVSGARIGTLTRPLEDGAVAVAPSRRFGLRVHGSTIVPAARPTALDSNDYASLDDYADYKDTP